MATRVSLLLKRQVIVIDTVALKDMIPWGRRYVLTSVLSPVDVGLVRKTPAPLRRTSGTVMKGRILIRTPSFKSGSHPMGCCWRGFHRTKISYGFSPSRISLPPFSPSAATSFSSAPSTPCATASRWRSIHSPRYVYMSASNVLRSSLVVVDKGGEASFNPSQICQMKGGSGTAGNAAKNLSRSQLSRSCPHDLHQQVAWPVYS